MSTIALFLCSGFVFFMLRLDRKQAPEVSFAFWVPTLWLMTIASKPLGVWLQSGAETIEEGSTIDRAFLTVLLVLGLLILIKRHFNWSTAIKANIYAITLIVFMLSSCIFSNDVFVSFKRWLRDSIALIMAFVVASEKSPRKALESLFRRIVYVLIPFSLVLINYYSQYGRMYVHHSGDLMWIGAAMHKNTLAQLCIFTIFFLTWTFLGRSQGRNVPAVWYQTYLEGLILALAIWLAGGPDHSPTYSATATLACCMALSLLAGLHFLKRKGIMLGRNVFAALALVLIVYGTITPMVGGLAVFDVSSVVGRDTTLTGRTEVWRQLVPVAMSQPILGHGFGGFWTTSTRERFEISEAHNGYLEIILQLGFAGLLSYMLFILSSVRKAQETMLSDWNWGVLWICCLVMGLVVNITESSFSSFTSNMLAIVLFMTVSSLPSNRDSLPYPEDY